MAAKQGLTAHISQASEDAKRAVLSRAPNSIKSHSWLSNLNTTCTIKSAPPRTPEVMTMLSCRAGWLVKRNEQHVWQRRWCCVVPHTFLYYFEAEPLMMEDYIDEEHDGGAGWNSPSTAGYGVLSAEDQEKLNVAVRDGYREGADLPRRASYYPTFGSSAYSSSSARDNGLNNGNTNNYDLSLEGDKLDAATTTRGPTAPSSSNLSPVGIIDLECYTNVNRSRINENVMELTGDSVTNPDLRSFYFQAANPEECERWTNALLSDRHSALKDEREAYRQVCDSFPIQLQQCSDMIDEAEAKAAEAEKEAYRVRSIAEDGRRRVIDIVREVLERECWDTSLQDRNIPLENSRLSFLSRLDSDDPAGGVTPPVQLLAEYLTTIIASFSDISLELTNATSKLAHSANIDRAALAQLRSNIEQMEQDRVSERHKYDGRINDLQSELDAVRLALEDAEQQSEARRVEFNMYQTQAKSKMRSLGQHKKILKKEVIELRSKVDEMGSERDAANHKMENLKVQLQTEKERYKVLEKFVEKMEGQVRVQQNMMEMMSQGGGGSVVGRVIGGDGGSLYGGSLGGAGFGASSQRSGQIPPAPPSPFHHRSPSPSKQRFRHESPLPPSDMYPHRGLSDGGYRSNSNLRTTNSNNNNNNNNNTGHLLGTLNDTGYRPMGDHRLRDTLDDKGISNDMRGPTGPTSPLSPETQSEINAAASADASTSPIEPPALSLHGFGNSDDDDVDEEAVIAAAHPSMASTENMDDIQGAGSGLSDGTPISNHHNHPTSLRKHSSESTNNDTTEDIADNNKGSRLSSSALAQKENVEDVSFEVAAKAPVRRGMGRYQRAIAIRNKTGTRISSRAAINTERSDVEQDHGELDVDPDYAKGSSHKRSSNEETHEQAEAFQQSNSNADETSTLEDADDDDDCAKSHISELTEDRTQKQYEGDHSRFVGGDENDGIAPVETGLKENNADVDVEGPYGRLVPIETDGAEMNEDDHYPPRYILGGGASTTLPPIDTKHPTTNIDNDDPSEATSKLETMSKPPVMPPKSPNNVSSSQNFDPIVSGLPRDNAFGGMSWSNGWAAAGDGASVASNGSRRMSVAQRARVDAERRGSATVRIPNNSNHSTTSSRPPSPSPSVRSTGSGSFFSSFGKSILGGGNGTENNNSAITKAGGGGGGGVSPSRANQAQMRMTSEAMTPLQKRQQMQRERQIAFLKQQGLMQDDGSMKGGGGGGDGTTMEVSHSSNRSLASTSFSSSQR